MLKIPHLKFSLPALLLALCATAQAQWDWDKDLDGIQAGRLLIKPQTDLLVGHDDRVKISDRDGSEGDSYSDLAASVYRGIVGYTIEPAFQPVEVCVPLTAVYCGYKTPTPEVIQRVEQLKAADPLKYERIYDEMDVDAKRAIAALQNHDFPTFGKLLNRNQELMEQMGVNTPELAAIVSALQAAPDVFGAKISGSGLGDCAIGVGYADLSELDYPVYHLEITPEGCQYHE